MYFALNDYYWRLADKLHLIVFGHHASPQMKQFFKAVSWSAVGLGFSLVISFFGNGFIARSLGVIEYGKFSLLIMISQFLIFLMVFNLDTITIKGISQSNNTDMRKKNILAPHLFLLISVPVVSILFIIVSRYAPNLRNLNADFLTLVITYSGIFAIRTISDAVVRGLQNFKRQALTRVTEVVVIYGGLSALFFIENLNLNTVVLFLSVGALFYSLFSALKYISIPKKIDLSILKDQLGHSSILFAGGFIGMFVGYSDRFMLTRSLGVAALGIYAAYISASSLITANLATLFLNSFYPTLSKTEEKKYVFFKLNRLLVLVALPLILAVICMEWFTFKIYGSQFPFLIPLVLGFALLAFIQFVLTIYHFLIISISKLMFQRYLLNSTIIGVLYVLLLLILSESGKLTILITLLSLITMTLSLVASQYYLLNRIERYEK